MQHVAEGSLVRGDLTHERQPRKLPRHDQVQEKFRVTGIEFRRRPDGRHGQSAHPGAVGGKNLRPLGCGEGDGGIGLEGLPGGLAAVGGQPGGNVDRQHAVAPPPGVDVLDDSEEAALDRTSQSGAEHPVHHHFAIQQPGAGLFPGRLIRQRLHRAPRLQISLIVCPGISLQVVRPGHHRHPGLVTSLQEIAGADQGIAAVVAFAAEDADPAEGRELLQEEVGQVPAGVLHQVAVGLPGLLDRPLVDALHLLGGENLHGDNALAAASLTTSSPRSRSAPARW